MAFDSAPPDVCSSIESCDWWLVATISDLSCCCVEFDHLPVEPQFRLNGSRIYDLMGLLDYCKSVNFGERLTLLQLQQYILWCKLWLITKARQFLVNTWGVSLFLVGHLQKQVLQYVESFLHAPNLWHHSRVNRALSIQLENWSGLAWHTFHIQ